jgi:hypothetical protein
MLFLQGAASPPFCPSVYLLSSANRPPDNLADDTMVSMQLMGRRDATLSSRVPN